MLINIDTIRGAQEKISSFVHKTPLIHSNSLSSLSGAEVYLKLENLQKTGSFKVRGAFNKMVRLMNKSVVAASMGNHAQAVAFAALKLGKNATIVMPVTAPLIKQEATKGYGAEVVLYGSGFKEAMEHARAQKDREFIHPFDDDLVIAGQGTIGLEILDELENIDALFVPVGGGGLISGISAAVKALSPKTRVIGVQAESATSACVSFNKKSICEIAPIRTIADGIAVNRIGDKTFEHIIAHVDDMVRVSEDAIARAILLFLERKKLVVEGAGAVPLAALLEQGDRFRGKRVVLVVSGGNIDFTLVDRIILKGLVTSHRIGVFSVVIDDVAGSLHAVTGVLGVQKANILDVAHVRLDSSLPIGRTRVVFTVEVRGKEHLDEILQGLRDKGYEVDRR